LFIGQKPTEQQGTYWVRCIKIYTDLNWNIIKTKGIKYVYVRAADSRPGIGYNRDPMASKHTLSIKAAGLPIGFYYIPRWSSEDYSINKAKAEAKRYADHIWSMMNSAGYNSYGDLLPVLDIEPVRHQIDVGLTPKQIVQTGLFGRVGCNCRYKYCKKPSLMGRRVL
jgi:GH25 family lysozyme M1 (1,4-beta-N-acetylmuramidase)